LTCSKEISGDESTTSTSQKKTRLFIFRRLHISHYNRKESHTTTFIYQNEEKLIFKVMKINITVKKYIILSDLFTVLKLIFGFSYFQQ